MREILTTSPFDLPPPVVLGSSFFSVPLKKSFIPPANARWWNGYLGTEYQFARSLLLSLPRPRWGKRDFENYLFFRSPPVFFLEEWRGEGRYIDVKEAYFQILLRGGINLDISPGQYVRFGAPFSFPYPSEWKQAKRGLLSLSSFLLRKSVWMGGERENIKSFTRKNSLFRPQWWIWVMGFLHSLAFFAMKWGAKYCNTDGFIIPLSRADSFSEFFSEIGVEWSVKAEGDFEILGVGRWKVVGREGEEKTKLFSSPRISLPHRNIKVDEELANWFVSHFKNSPLRDIM